MIEIRLHPDGYAVQYIPIEALGPGTDPARRWVCLSWPGNIVTATLFTDEEAADWRVLYREGK
jgi:hypothetical protein